MKTEPYKKILIFDVDGTLCDINKPINKELVTALQRIDKKDILVLASGKPFGYLAGFARQLALENCIIVGENGATINYSATFPPVSYYHIDISNKTIEIFSHIKNTFKSKFKNKIWFQPNDINLTIFPINIEDIEEVHSFAKQFEAEDIHTYYHKDSVDFTPKGFNKGTAVDILLKKFNISKQDLYVFGDGTNDLPMLTKTPNAYLVNSKLENFEPKKTFNNYEELTNFLNMNF